MCSLEKNMKFEKKIKIYLAGNNFFIGLLLCVSDLKSLL